MENPSKVASSMSVLNQRTYSQFVKNNFIYCCWKQHWRIIWAFPAGSPPAHFRRRVARPCIQRSTARLNFPKGAPCAWGIQSVWLCQLPATRWAPLATTAPRPHPSSCFGPTFIKCWLKWHHWGMVWKNLWPIHFTSRLHLWLKSDQKAGPNCHNSPPVYLKWVCHLLSMRKIQISLSLSSNEQNSSSLSLSLCVYKCVCVSIYILQIYIYIYLEYITLIDGGP